MASTPADFAYSKVTWTRGFDVIEGENGVPTASELIDKVLVPVAIKLSLPLAIKIGAHRNMSKGLDPCGMPRPLHSDPYDANTPSPHQA